MFVSASAAKIIYHVHSTVMEVGTRTFDDTGWIDIYHGEIMGVPLKATYFEEEINNGDNTRFHCILEAPAWLARWHSGMKPQRSGCREAMIFDLIMFKLSDEMTDE